MITMHVSLQATRNATEDAAQVEEFVSNKIEEIRKNGPTNIANVKELGIGTINVIPGSVQVVEKPKMFCQLGSILVGSRCCKCRLISFHR